MVVAHLSGNTTRQFTAVESRHVPELSTGTATLQGDSSLSDLVRGSDITDARSEESFSLVHKIAEEDLLAVAGRKRFSTILADPPWRFQNSTGKVAPGHRRLNRYGTMSLDDICALPVPRIVADKAHIYLWCPNAILPDGLKVLEARGFTYKANLVWHKIRKDGGPDGRGVGFYFRNVTELILSGIKGKNARTLARSPPAAARLIFLPPASASIAASPMSNTQSTSHAHPGLILKCLHVARVAAGQRGGTRRTRHIFQLGRPTPITPKHTAKRPNIKARQSYLKETTPAGNPINRSGHGLPTPRLTRSASFRQWVVAAPNLSDTKGSAHASANDWPRSTRR